METLLGKVLSQRKQCFHTKNNTVKEKDKELLVRAGIASTPCMGLVSKAWVDPLLDFDFCLKSVSKRN